MKVDGIGLQTMGAPDRAVSGVRNRGGTDRFSVEGVDRPERSGGDDPHPLYSDRVGNRRRQAARVLRHKDAAHSVREHTEELHTAEAGEFHFDLDPDGADGDGRGENEEEAAEDRAAAAADFEALSAHLLRLGGPIREVTLYLPSLGQVTARLEAGAISILVCVPRRLVGAVQRGERELQKQMGALGLRIAQFQIRERDEPQELQRPEAPRHWPAHGLVDVMA